MRMVTKIKTRVYEAKLRKKLAELKAERPKLLKAHKDALVRWRKALLKWLVENGPSRVDAIKLERRNRFHRDGEAAFDTRSFFAGAPQAPVLQDDKQIREIQSLLRHLAISKQETVQVSTEDVERYLGDRGQEDVERQANDQPHPGAVDDPGAGGPQNRRGLLPRRRKAKGWRDA
jgi:hypothetical protein